MLTVFWVESTIGYCRPISYNIRDNVMSKKQYNVLEASFFVFTVFGLSENEILLKYSYFQNNEISHTIYIPRKK